MRLSEFVIPTDSVELAPGQTLVVRGLNFNDLYLVGLKDTPTLEKLFNSVSDKISSNEEFTVSSVKEMLFSAAREFPELVGKLVACAAEEPGSDAAAAIFARLPPGPQLELLEKIVSLTVVSEAELKKLQEVVIRLVGMVTVVVTTATTVAPMPSGSGASAQK